jgi:uncharacterized protein
MSSLPPFSLLIKPAGADCNLRCTYCFYLEKAALYPEQSRHRMSEAVLTRLVSSYLATDQPHYAFGWQGGEPTLMGVDFFRAVTRLQQQHGRPGASVANGLQTNGTLLDDAFAAHLAAYSFLAGVSLDGPPDFHDAYRKTADHGPSHARVLAGIETLRRHHVDYNILTLVNDRNGRHPGRLYRYLAHQGHRFQQYIPCVAFDGNGTPLPYSLVPEIWGDFLCELFDNWYPHDVRRVSIRLFDSILTRLVDHVANVCSMGRTCCQYFLVEHNGDVYPCDFFVEPELRLGNIMENEWAELFHSPRYQAFGDCKSRWNPACDACPWLDFCAGDCPKHRYAGTRDPRQISFLCEGWKRFFAHTMPRFRQLADEIREERRAQTTMTPSKAGLSGIGRNAPCPCGSGRKFKHCCGARQT